MQALPGGEETDFILVSCAGAAAADNEPVTGARMLSAKRRGENALRGSGLGYTIVRPGPLIEEPGGYKALVFDQVRVLRLTTPLSVGNAGENPLHHASVS